MSPRSVGSSLQRSWRDLPATLHALVLGAFFFTLLMAAVAQAREASALVLLLMILGILLVLPHAVRIAQGRWEAFDPLVAFTGICTFGYFLRSMHLLWHEHADLYHIPVDSIHAVDLLGVGVTLVILGVLSFYAGYGSRVGPAIAARLPMISNLWTLRRLRIVWILFTIIGAVAYTIFVNRAGGFLHVITNMQLRSEASAGAHIYYVFIRFMPMALLFRQVMLLRAQASRLAWFTFGVHAFVVIVLLAMLGSRAWAFEVLFLLLTVRHFLYKPVRARSLFLVVVSALLVFAVFHQYRNITHEGVEAGELDLLELDRLDTFYDGMFGGRNFDMMDNLLSIVYFTGDRFEHLEGSSYLHFFVNLVPRALWEGKPEGVGSLLVKNVYGWGAGGAPPGAIGEAYLNWSWLGIIPALLLLGLFSRLVRDYALDERANAFAIFVLAISFVFVLMVTRGTLYQVGSTVVMRFVPLLIGALIASGMKFEARTPGRRRRRRRRRRRSRSRAQSRSSSRRLSGDFDDRPEPAGSTTGREPSPRPGRNPDDGVDPVSP